MKVVYIAGPFRGPDSWVTAQNIRRAETLAWQVWEAGFVALCPHLNTINFQHSLSDGVWLAGDLELLSRCDVVLMTEDWVRSSGARSEKVFAEDQGIPVFYSLETLMERYKELHG